MESREHFKQGCGMSIPITIMYYVTNHPKFSGLAQPFCHDHKLCGSGKWTKHS